MIRVLALCFEAVIYAAAMVATCAFWFVVAAIFNG